MSEGCLFFTLKMTMQALGTGIFLTGNFSRLCKLVKTKKCQYLGLEAKNEKDKGTLLFGTSNV